MRDMLGRRKCVSWSTFSSRHSASRLGKVKRLARSHSPLAWAVAAHADPCGGLPASDCWRLDDGLAAEFAHHLILGAAIADRTEFGQRNRLRATRRLWGGASVMLP
jgi:hypothetical protein